MIQLYNTLTRQVEPFKPVKRGRAHVYNCGPTVYSYVHIGNLRSFLFADLLRRLLDREGYEVTQVMNLTDVGHMLADADVGEDKLEYAAAKEGKTPEQVADHYADAFFKDIADLDIRRAHVYPRASRHVAEMMALISRLLEAGHAYKVTENGGTSVYYDVSSFPQYGELSGNSVENLDPGARIEVRDSKKHPADFALWIHNPKHFMQWEAPWGKGYPGWHIECSAMAMKYLGETLDIHTGGEDNKFPHHECEIAQSEGATGKPFAKYWLHVTHLLVEGEKMSKSKGNFFTLGELRAKGYAAREVRYLLLSAHYRQQLNFTFAGLDAARGALKRLDDFADALKHAAPTATGRPTTYGRKALKKVTAGLQNDLNAAEALAQVFEYVSEMNAKMAAGKLTERDRLSAKEFLAGVGDLFGFQFGQDVDPATLPPSITALIEKRDKAREERCFAEADRLRDEIKTAGYVIEDTPEGRRIKRV